jgi:hypothetical protein
MSAGKKIEELFETLNNGNIGDFKKGVRGMRKLTLAQLLIAADDEPNPDYIKRLVIDALD